MSWRQKKNSFAAFYFSSSSLCTLPLSVFGLAFDFFFRQALTYPLIFHTTTAIMGTGKKEAARKVRQGKPDDGMANVKTKGENFYRYVQPKQKSSLFCNKY